MRWLKAHTEEVPRGYDTEGSDNAFDPLKYQPFHTTYPESEEPGVLKRKVPPVYECPAVEPFKETPYTGAPQQKEGPGRETPYNKYDEVFSPGYPVREHRPTEGWGKAFKPSQEPYGIGSKSVEELVPGNSDIAMGESYLGVSSKMNTWLTRRKRDVVVPTKRRVKRKFHKFIDKMFEPSIYSPIFALNETSNLKGENVKEFEKYVTEAKKQNIDFVRSAWILNILKRRTDWQTKKAELSFATLDFFKNSGIEVIGEELDILKNLSEQANIESAFEKEIPLAPISPLPEGFTKDVPREQMEMMGFAPEQLPIGSKFVVPGFEGEEAEVVDWAFDPKKKEYQIGLLIPSLGEIYWEPMRELGMGKKWEPKFARLAALLKVARVVHRGNKWCVQAESGRNMGCYDTKEKAVKRLRQIEYFKHAGSLIKEADVAGDIENLKKDLELEDEAIKTYEEHIEATDDEDLKEKLTEIKDEEIHHVGELKDELMKLLDQIEITTEEPAPVPIKPPEELVEKVTEEVMEETEPKGTEE
jgi:hypothetical protein